MRTTALIAASFSAPFLAGSASAQESSSRTQTTAGRDDTEQGFRPFRISAAFAGDAFDYETDRSNLDDNGRARMLRLQFEGMDEEGRGLGLRFEGLASDDDFFRDAGFVDTRVTDYSLFAHATKSIGSDRFQMPIHFGLLANLQHLEEQSAPIDVDYWSLGPYVELAPEYELVHGGTFRCWVYGEFGFGVGGTKVHIDNDPGKYLSWSSFAGAEAGMRFCIGTLEIGAAYVGRWQSMDQSGPENGMVAFAYHTDFQGLLVSFGLRF